MKKYVCIILSIVFMQSVCLPHADAAWWDRFRRKPAPKPVVVKKAPVVKKTPVVKKVPVAPAPVVKTPAKETLVSTPAPKPRVAPIKQKRQAEPAKEMTKEDMLIRLNGVFTYNPDILSATPGVERMEDANGVYFQYNGTRLEDLDKETLLRLLRAANQQLSFKNFEKLQKQLKNLKQIENMNRTQRMLRQTNQQVPSVPRTYTPPKIPKVYKPVKTYKTPGR